jgi:hypothetical protein
MGKTQEPCGPRKLLPFFQASPCHGDGDIFCQPYRTRGWCITHSWILTTVNGSELQIQLRAWCQAPTYTLPTMNTLCSRNNVPTCHTQGTQILPSRPGLGSVSSLSHWVRGLCVPPSVWVRTTCVPSPGRQSSGFLLEGTKMPV